MEQLWNLIYLTLGAVIATFSSILGDKIKNRGKIFFDKKSFSLDPKFKMKDTGTGGRKRTDDLEYIEVSVNIEIINTSKEYVVCRDLKICIETDMKGKFDEYEVLKANISSGTQYFINSKRLSLLNIKPNSAEEYSIFFNMNPPMKNTFERNVYIGCKTKKNKRKEYLLDLLKFEISNEK